MDDLRAMNIKQNEEDYMERRLVLKSLPTMLFVELTQNCNLSCKMCRSAQKYDKALNMSREVFNLVARDLFPYAAMVDLRGWGESTILHDFEEKLRVTLDSGVRVRLVTNGLAMTERLWEMFFEGDNVIAVSFDSSNAEVFKQLGRGDFNKVVRNLRQGVAIRDRAGRGTIYLKVVVNSFTLHELPDIIRLAADIGLHQVGVNAIRISESHPAHLKQVKSKVPAAFDYASQVAQQLGVKMYLGSTPEYSLRVDYGLKTTCASPWSHALISYEGRVGFCDHIINNPEYTFGSLSESSFQEIWNGPAYQSFRAQHIAAEKRRRLSKAFVECTWCYHHRYLDSEHSPFHTVSKTEVSTSTGLPLYQIRGGEPVEAAGAGAVFQV
jgi:MoaA/NifB/PqqE/SkfB family radical SAM enzyme